MDASDGTKWPENPYILHLRQIIYLLNVLDSNTIASKMQSAAHIISISTFMEKLSHPVSLTNPYK